MDSVTIKQLQDTIKRNRLAYMDIRISESTRIEMQVLLKSIKLDIERLKLVISHG